MASKFLLAINSLQRYLTPKDVIIKELKKQSDKSLLDLIPAKKTPNIFTARYKGKYIHSPYDPISETQKIIEKQLSVNTISSDTLIFVFGTGLGYILEQLSKIENVKDNIVIAVELIPELALFTIENLPQLPPNFFIITPANIPDIFTITNFLDFSTIKDIRFLEQKAITSLYPEDSKNFLKEVEDLVKAKLTDVLTRVYFEKIWFKNICRNLPIAIRSGGINILAEILRDIPCAIVSAGPSLSSSIFTLKKYQNNLFIISTDTALRTLLKHNIYPDIVVSLDAQIANLRDFFIKTIPEKSILIMDLVTHPATINYWYKPNVLFSYSAHIEVTYDRKEIYTFTNSFINYFRATTNFEFGSLESGGSVSTNAFFLALIMGCNPIIFFGLDLSYPSLLTHAKYTNPFLFSLNNQNIFSTMYSFPLRSITSKKYMKDGNLYTDLVMNNYRLWFESAIATSNVAQIYRIGEGIKIKGIKDITPEGLPNIIPNKKIDKEKIYNFIMQRKLSLPLENVRRVFRAEVENLLKYLDKWKENIKIEALEEMINKELWALKDIFFPYLVQYNRNLKNIQTIEAEIKETINFVIKKLSFMLDLM